MCTRAHTLSILVFYSLIMSKNLLSIFATESLLHWLSQVSFSINQQC